MSRLARACLLWVLAASPVLAAEPADVDEERAAWRYRWSVTLPAADARRGLAFAALTLAPEVGARSQPDLRDLRLVGADGREIQYVLDRAVSRESTPGWTGRLADVVREARRRSVWVVDLGDPRAFDSIALDVRQQDFAKRIRVEASDDSRAWRLVRQDAGIFDRPLSFRVHHTTITLPERLVARYLRLTADDTRSRPVEVYGVVASATRRTPGEQWRRPVVLDPIPAGSRVSRYRLDLPLLEAQSVVRVPRIAFKAAPGAYRLLIGNAQAQPPRYDIASLRKEILSYSAVVVDAGPIETNTAFRRGAGDYVKDVPPSLLLWGTLLGAVIVLLLLTVRILRTSQAQGSGERP